MGSLAKKVVSLADFWPFHWLFMPRSPKMGSLAKKVVSLADFSQSSFAPT
jgi:hypothetical protein